MKVLFVYSDISGAEHYGARKYYSGVGSLSAVLKEAGHHTALLYLQRALSEEEFLAEVDAAEPGLVAFSATTHQYPAVERYARALQAARPGLPRLVGGTHATLAPEEVAASGAFHAVCVGEGEYPLRELCARLEEAGQRPAPLVGRVGDPRPWVDPLEWGEIQNLWLCHEGQVQRNALRPLIADLDELPYVDRELFDFDAILAANNGWVDIMAGRGCPYNCSYCCNPGLKQRYAGLGRYVRWRSVEHVLGELRELRARYPVKTINFQDDTFTLDIDWTLDFCRAYGAEFELPFWVNTRAERLLDERVVGALAEAGCVGVRIGVENGDEALRRSVLKRTMSNEELIRAFDLARRHGLKTYTCNMIGVPGETPETIQATIALNRRLAPDQFQFSVFYPYPLTELFDTCTSQGLLKAEDAGQRVGDPRPSLARGIKTRGRRLRPTGGDDDGRGGSETRAPEAAPLTDYYGKESVLSLPTLSDAELAQGYERFEALRAELALKRASPKKYALYRLLLAMYADDGPRLQRHLDALRRSLRRRRRRQD